MDKLISVIIPVYNVSEYLPCCLDSIINQTYKNLEIILVDDGSTDISGTICDEYAKKDSRIKVLHKENNGVSSARNTGIDISSGDYIGFVDSDDYIDVNMYKRLIENAEKYDADISMCQIQKRYLNGEFSELVVHESGLLTKSEIMNGFFENGFIKDIMYSVYDKLYKKELLSDIRFKKYYMGEDILFSFETLLMAQNVYYDNNVGYYYLLRENSAMTSRFSYKRFDYILAGLDMVDLCAEHLDESVLNKARKWLFCHVLINYRAMIINKMIKEYPNKAQEYKKYLLEHRSLFSALNTKRKIDYIMTIYFPYFYKIKR